ncbi:hypothetical protein D1868_00110 [Stygiolobus azoricus]|uniref:Uncharacterized protein n=1 Tax=Stygiolobus azoricus TaxID=41675 RepID=A0A650CL02_9CREN|nr:hypothetical protein D1868_00110 [Stygiolobus azoricus]
MLSSVIQNCILLTLQKVSVNFCNVYSLEVWDKLVKGKTGNFVIVGRSEGERGEIKWYDHEVKGRLTLRIDRGTLKAYFQNEEKTINLLDLGYIYTWVSEKISSSNRYIGLCQTSKRRGRIEVTVVKGIDVYTSLDKEKIDFILTQIFGEGVKLLKVVVSDDFKHVYLQFFRNGVYWFSEMERLALKHQSLTKELIDLKKEIMSILNR